VRVRVRVRAFTYAFFACLGSVDRANRLMNEKTPTKANEEAYAAGMPRGVRGCA